MNDLRLQDRSEAVTLNGWECYVINAWRALDQLLELQELSHRHEVTIGTGGFPACTAFIARVDRTDAPEDSELWRIQVGINYPTLDIFTAGADDLTAAQTVLAELVSNAIARAMRDSRVNNTSV